MHPAFALVDGVCRSAAFLSIENITRCGIVVKHFLPHCGRKFLNCLKKMF
jgi:hypothetical protein